MRGSHDPNSRQRTLNTRRLETCKHVNIRPHVRWNTAKERENKQMTGFITLKDDRCYLGSSHSHKHTLAFAQEELSVSVWQGRCSRDLRQENSSELKRQESEKQDTWEEGKWRGKTRSSHVGISVGKTWSLKTATAQGCLSMFVVLNSHHRGRVQFSLGSPFSAFSDTSEDKVSFFLSSSVTHCATLLRCPHCDSV